MIILYNIIISVLFLSALPFLPFLYFFSGKKRANLLQRLGVFTGLKKKQGNEKRIWIHALSVGEVRSSGPFVTSFKKKYSDVGIVFTASTRTGFETARKLFDADTKKTVDFLGYFPFDLWFSVKRVSEIITPDAVCIVETDLWPNFLLFHAKKRIPVVLINARLSFGSLKGYQRFGRFSALFLSSFSKIMVQTETDAGRYESLGIDKKKLIVTGNIKFDQMPPQVDREKVSQIKKKFGFDDDKIILMAGSTHGGEEDILADLFWDLKKKSPNLVLMIAPRDPERCEKILPLFLDKKIPAVSMNQPGAKGSSEPQVVLIDKMGILAMLYAICDLAFVGGSMVKKGGHNPLEPAAFLKPVLFGPHMTDFFEVSKILTHSSGAMTVQTKEELKTAVLSIVNDKEKQKKMGARNYQVFKENSGAVERTITVLEQMNFV
jgi:3-deoxy-D-manno-octulosonic-acid transferase